MYQPYEDILSRMIGEPHWWDENGVPRYETFHPSMCADIYADYAALLMIKCQGCGRYFPVAASWSIVNAIDSFHTESSIQWDENWKNGKPMGGLPDSTSKDSGYFCYGDAPWHTSDGSQCSGTTMTTDVASVVEFWGRNLGKLRDWERMPQHEYTKSR